MRPLADPSRSSPLRRLAFLGLVFIAAIVSCGKDVTAPLGSAARLVRALSFNAVFPPAYQAAGGSSSGIVAFSRVHVVLHHSDGTVALDTMIDFPAGVDEITLSLTVTLLGSAPASGEPMTLDLGYLTTAGDVVFHGGPVAITAAPPPAGGGANPPVTIPVSYTGPGANAAAVVIAPRSGTVVAGSAFTFAALAKDNLGATIPATPIIWNSLDPSIATITSAAAGAGLAQNLRGTARIVAQLLTGPADTVRLTVTLPASQIIAQSGNAQTGVVGTTLALPLVVKVAASDGVGVAGTTVNFAVASGGGSLATASVVSDATGLAQTTWTLGASIGAQSATATAGTLTNSPLTFTATAQAATAAKLVVTTQPGNGGVGAALAPFTFTAEDNNGNIATTFTGPVTVTFGANPSGATLGGTATVNAVAGLATFSALTISKAGTAYTLVASATGLTSATTSTFDIVGVAASSLVFTVQPSNAFVGAAIAPAIVVNAQDAQGNPTPSFTGAVTLALGFNPGAALLGGTTTRNAVAGVATFAAITLNRPGSGYTLTASAPSTGSSTSTTFDITVPGGLRTWTGATSTDWGTASNWSPAGVPQSTDDVVIPVVANQPILSAPAAVNSLNVTAGATLTNSSTLTVSGNLDSYAINGGTVNLTGTGHLSGMIGGNLNVTGGVRTLSGETSISGDVTVTGSATVLDAGVENDFYITGSFATRLGGVLKMTDYAYMIVYGNATFEGGSTAGKLTNGYLRIYGNFAQGPLGSPSAFAPDPAHETDIGSNNSLSALRVAPALRGNVRAGALPSSTAASPVNKLTRAAPKQSASSMARAKVRATAMARAAKSAAVFVARRQWLSTKAGPFTSLTSIAPQVLNGIANVSFANPGFGASLSHFGSSYIQNDFTLTSDVFFAGDISADGATVTGSNNVLTSAGAGYDGLYGLVFNNVRWVLVDGSDVGSTDNITFTNMDPTVDQFTVQRAGSNCGECSNNIYLSYWTFATVPTTGHYIKAVDTDGATPNVLDVYAYSPTPATHGGHILSDGIATITNWPGPVDWVGTASTNWGDGLNWSTGFAPGGADYGSSFDDVFIRSAAPNSPVLNRTGSAGNLTIEAGKSIALNNNNMYVYGNVVAPVATTAVTCGGDDSFQLYGNGGPNTIVGKFCIATLYGSYQVSGPGNQFSVIGNLDLYGSANLNVSGGQVDVGGAFYLWSSSTLTMQNPADVMNVGSGGAYFNGGSTTGLLTNGVLTINGGCVHNSSGALDGFAPSGTHKTVFTNGTSSVEFQDPSSSFFQNVDITGGSSVQLLSDVTIKGTLARSSAGVITISTGGLPQTLTVSGLNQTGADAMSFVNVSLRFIDGTANATFDNVSFTGFPVGFAGSTFEVNRSDVGGLTFSNLNFLSAGFTPDTTKHFLNLSGSANLHMATPVPGTGTLGTEWIQMSTGTVTWP